MTLLDFAGLSLIIVPILFNLAFFALARSFEYPDILRKPTDEILRRFTAGGTSLVTLWYLFAMTALLSIPMTLLVFFVYVDTQPALAITSAIFGALSGLVQTLGLLRWSFVVPSLAARYADPSATPAVRDAAQVTFDAFHHYAGVAIGEHLGYLFTASWTFVAAAMMAASPLFASVLPLLGIAAGVGILVGLLEPAGWKPAGMINAISYLVWSLWLVLAGLTFLFA
ncbi:MAG: DUF4386 domain-containing protein [Anaerolineae bacterium]|nr:DUF4386 domain-containing protein [Anaerolineae bacterium]